VGVPPWGSMGRGLYPKGGRGVSNLKTLIFDHF